MQLHIYVSQIWHYPSNPKRLNITSSKSIFLLQLGQAIWQMVDGTGSHSRAGIWCPPWLQLNWLYLNWLHPEWLHPSWLHTNWNMYPSMAITQLELDSRYPIYKITLQLDQDTFYHCISIDYISTGYFSTDNIPIVTGYPYDYISTGSGLSWLATSQLDIYQLTPSQLIFTSQLYSSELVLFNGLHLSWLHLSWLHHKWLRCKTWER